MSGWGQNDQAVTANSTTTIETTVGEPTNMQAWAIHGFAQVGQVMGGNASFGNTSPGSVANVDYNLYGNTTVGAFIPNMAVGIFAVNATSMSTTGGSLVNTGILTSYGSGYAANAAVTLTVVNGGSGATANALANSSGKITTLIANQVGTGFITGPLVAIAPPSAINVDANTTSFEPKATNTQFTSNSTAVATNTFITVTSANTNFVTGQKVIFYTPASNVALSPLANNGYYYIAFSNTTVLSLANTLPNALSNTPIVLVPNTTVAVFGEIANVSDVALITTANSLFQPGDQLFYGVPSSNTAVPPLVGNTYYYVTFSNTTALALSTTLNGANIGFAPSQTSTEVHTFTGTTATGYFDTNSEVPQVTSAGWVLRKEGTGGRAGRVQYETLVAMHSIGVNGSTNTGVYGTANVISSNASVATRL